MEGLIRCLFTLMGFTIKRKKKEKEEKIKEEVKGGGKEQNK